MNYGNWKLQCLGSVILDFKQLAVEVDLRCWRYSGIRAGKPGVPPDQG